MAQKLSLVIFISVILMANCIFSQSQEVPSGMKIWFRKPAETWNDALPVGNGRLGAMVFGGVDTERIELNEESIWTGEPRWDANPQALKTLPLVRKLLFEGRYREAEELAQKGILGWKPRDPPASYQALGDLYLDFGHQGGISNYRRELDLENAIAKVTYTSNRINFTREIFASFPDQALVIRLTADKPASMNFTCSISREGNKASIAATGNEITLNEHTGNGIGVKIFARLKLKTYGGTLTSSSGRLRVENADIVTILVTAGTDYSGKILRSYRGIRWMQQ